MLFATIARKGQFPEALRLAQSVRNHHGAARIALCLIDHLAPAAETAPFDDVLLVTNHGLPSDSAKHCGAAKAYFIHTMLHRFPQEPLVYLDPEVEVVGPFDDIFQLLQHQEIVAAPYYLEPLPGEQSALEIERLKKGFLHAGFLALANTDRSRRFAAWWLKKLEAASFGGTASAETEHQWLSLGAVPFGIHVLKEPGYHAADWNRHEALRSGIPIRSWVHGK